MHRRSTRLNPAGLFRGLLVCGAVICFLLPACTTYPPPERSPNDLPFPDSFTLYEKTVESPDRWWESFGSPELNRLPKKPPLKMPSSRQLSQPVQNQRPKNLSNRRLNHLPMMSDRPRLLRTVGNQPQELPQKRRLPNLEFL